VRRRAAALLAVALSHPAVAAAQRPGRDSANAVPLKPVEATARRRVLPVSGKFRPATDSALLAAGLRTRVAGRWLSVTLEGMLPTPSPCYRLAGAADRTGQAVTINVEARPNGDLCSPAPTAFRYRLRVPLPAGSYTLRVLHSYRHGAYPASVALDTAVTVRGTRRSDFLPWTPPP
jgi:hypothetical protein